MKRVLQENLERVHERIRSACERQRRDPADVLLVAVTKYVTVDVIRLLIELGVHDLGESQVQELTRRAAMIAEGSKRRALVADKPSPTPRWHMIGHLQRNKVAKLLPHVTMIHSVDSLRLAEEIDHRAVSLGSTAHILLQVNASQEPQKFGVPVPAVTHLAEQLATLSNTRVRGLMTMAPLADDESVVRAAFQRTRELFEEIRGEELCGPDFDTLSMGMSHDFELAVEHGATVVRIGSALFEGIHADAGAVSQDADALDHPDDD